MSNKKECVIKNCSGVKCGCGCCDDEEVVEWVVEYLSFHERMRSYLEKHGIKVEFFDDRVRFKNCSDGKECKFIKYATNKNIDARPIDCKIYPYSVDWHTIDFDKKIVNLYYFDDWCPLVKKKKITSEFKASVVEILKRDFSLLFYGIDFKYNFIDKVIPFKYERLSGWLWTESSKYRKMIKSPGLPADEAGGATDSSQPACR